MRQTQIRSFLSRIFHREYVSIHQAAIFLIFTAFFSKVLALWRDRLLASNFGAGQILDIYYASFKIPDIIYTASLFLAASTALIPIFLKKLHENKESAEKFIAEILGISIFIILILIGAAYLSIPFFINFITPGFSYEDKKTVIDMSRILLLSPLFLSLSNIASSVIQSAGRFFSYALSPILYNAGIIVGVAVFFQFWGLKGLMFGVLLGAGLHFLIQIPTIIKLGFRFYPSLYFKKETIFSILGVSLPRALTLSLNQIVLIIMTALASIVGTGSIAVFNLASNLQSVPLTIIGSSYSLAAFPFLTRNIIKKDSEMFLAQVGSVIRHIFFWSLFSAVLFIILRAHIVRVILGAGNFDWVDTRLTAAGLGIFSLAILTQGLIMFFLRVFYAQGKTYLPLISGFISGVLSVGSALILLHFFNNSFVFQEWFERILRVQGLAGSSLLILPIAVVLGSTFDLSLLIFWFIKDFRRLHCFSFWRSIREVGAASLILGIGAYGFLNFSENLFNLNTFPGVFFHGFFAAVFGIFFTGLFLWLIKNQEFLEISGALKRRLTRFI